VSEEIDGPECFVVVRRKLFRLTLFERSGARYRETHRCPIAVGAVGFETPGGPFWVIAKAANPDWRMPDSSWVPEEKRGTIVPGGSPENPIKAAFLSLTPDGVGIHGTDNLLSLRSKASHGCVRVRPRDARLLFNEVPVGTPVYIQ
jgi:lipoprotein-anchoring transpeptidase ErfK/SrfK